MLASALMGKLYLSVLAIGLGSIVVAACVGDAAAPAHPLLQGTLNGPCFTNGTCNTGLSCVLVNGTGTCVPTDASTSDGSPGVDGSAGDSAAGDSADASLPICTFQTTSYPCQGAMACYSGGSQVGCVANVSTCTQQQNQPWECFSNKECTNQSCCLKGGTVTNVSAQSCSGGKVDFPLTMTNGSQCQAACSGALQLCLTNADCPPNGVCVAVTINSAGQGLGGQVVGACAF